jgi:hypothetical protein
MCSELQQITPSVASELHLSLFGGKADVQVSYMSPTLTPAICCASNLPVVANHLVMSSLGDINTKYELINYLTDCEWAVENGRAHVPGSTDVPCAVHHTYESNWNEPNG